VSNVDVPTALAADAESVYWTAGSDPFRNGARSVATVSKLPVNGGEPTALASGTDYGSALALDRDNVYWTTLFDWTSEDGAIFRDGKVMKVPLNGGEPSTLASGLIRPAAIALDEAHVYWAESGHSGSDGEVMAVPLDGGAPNALAIWLVAPSSVAVGGPEVYWSIPGGLFDRTGQVVGLPIFGVPMTLASGLSAPSGLVVDATRLYFEANGAIMSMPLGGGPLTTIVPATDSPGAFAIDDASVYWLTDQEDSDGGRVARVMKTPLGGGDSTILASL